LIRERHLSGESVRIGFGLGLAAARLAVQPAFQVGKQSQP
jgi:hypothetical protein